MLKIAFRLFKNCIKKVLGRIDSFPTLGSNTVEKDDAVICKKWLKKPDEWLNDERVEAFNSAFAKWNGSKFAFAFMGGRVALSACISALNLKPGDEVIIPGYTCIVVPNAFHFAGVNVIYADIELDTYGLSSESFQEKITSRTKAVLIHHLYGLVCRDYEKLIDIARKNNLFIIEDCAQATGSIFKGIKLGNLGDAAIYSSEQSKIFSTGQGGIATTNSPEIARGLRTYYDNASFPSKERISQLLATFLHNYYAYAHPQKWLLKDWAKYEFGNRTLISTTEEELKGIKPIYYGSRMPAPLAEIGINQLKKIDKFNSLRRENAKKWDSWCNRNGYKKPVVIKDSIPVFLRYPVMVEPEKKKNLNWVISDLHIYPGVWFTSNLHPSDTKITGCPNADKAVKGCINFPTLD